MNTNNPQQDSNHIKFIAWSLGIITAILISFAISYASKLLIPFVVAVIAFYSLAPLEVFFESKMKFPRWLAILMTLALAVIFFGLIVFSISIMLKSFVEGIDDFKLRLPSLAQKISPFLSEFHIYVSERSLVAQLKALPLFDIVKIIAGQLANLISNTAIVFIYVIFLMLGSSFDHTRDDMWSEVNTKIRHYMITKVVLSILTGVLVGGILFALGLDYAFMFGVMAFMLNFIPSLGSIIASFIPLPFAYIQNESLFFLLAVFFLPGTVQFILGSLVEPKIIGRSLNIHPVALLSSLIFWGLLWGIPGAFLAVPITVTIKIVFDHFEGTRKISLLLEGIVPTKKRGQ